MSAYIFINNGGLKMAEDNLPNTVDCYEIRI